MKTTPDTKCFKNDEQKEVLLEGDMLLLVDPKDRRYLLTLESNAEFHSHSGYISHEDLIGKEDGVRSSLAVGLNT